jgi:hypothetical protein
MAGLPAASSEFGALLLLERRAAAKQHGHTQCPLEVGQRYISVRPWMGASFRLNV